MTKMTKMQYDPIRRGLRVTDSGIVGPAYRPWCRPPGADSVLDSAIPVATSRDDLDAIATGGLPGRAQPSAGRGRLGDNGA
jgi:hypothetical protein